MEDLVEFSRKLDQQRRVAGPVGIEGRIALQHRHVPGAIQKGQFLLIMKIQALAADRLQTDVVVETGFLGEFLEDRGHAAKCVAIGVRAD